LTAIDFHSIIRSRFLKGGSVREPIGKMTPALAWERAATRGRTLLAEAQNPVHDPDFRDAVATIMAATLPSVGIRDMPALDTVAYKVTGALNALTELSDMTDAGWAVYEQLVRLQAEPERDITAILRRARQLASMDVGLTQREWLDRALHHARWGVPADARV
jgi:hypothetical protein